MNNNDLNTENQLGFHIYSIYFVWSNHLWPICPSSFEGEPSINWLSFCCYRFVFFFVFCFFANTSLRTWQHVPICCLTAWGWGGTVVIYCHLNLRNLSKRRNEILIVLSVVMLVLPLNELTRDVLITWLSYQIEVLLCLSSNVRDTSQSHVFVYPFVHFVCVISMKLIVVLK